MRAFPLMWKNSPTVTDGCEGEIEPFCLSQDLQFNLRPQLLQGKKHQINGVITLPHAATAPHCLCVCVTWAVIYPDLHRSTVVLCHFVCRTLYCMKNGKQAKQSKCQQTQLSVESNGGITLISTVTGLISCPSSRTNSMFY